PVGGEGGRRRRPPRAGARLVRGHSRLEEDRGAPRSAPVADMRLLRSRALLILVGGAPLALLPSARGEDLVRLRSGEALRGRITSLGRDSIGFTDPAKGRVEIPAANVQSFTLDDPPPG